MKIGIFGGSFNPVHVGHIALAVHCVELLHLDKLYIIPAHLNPFKEGSEVTAEHRLKMCKLAFKGVPKTKVLSLEVERKGPSYTIDTVNELKSKKLISSKDSLFLLLGQDSLEGFKNWKSVEELLQVVTPVVVARTGAKTVQKVDNILFVDMPLFDVSATVIRKRLHKNQFVGHLIQKNIYTYIQKHGLYT